MLLTHHLNSCNVALLMFWFDKLMVRKIWLLAKLVCIFVWLACSACFAVFALKFLSLSLNREYYNLNVFQNKICFLFGQLAKCPIEIGQHELMRDVQYYKTPCNFRCKWMRPWIMRPERNLHKYVWKFHMWLHRWILRWWIDLHWYVGLGEMIDAFLSSFYEKAMETLSFGRIRISLGVD